jgi:Putative adhesin
MVAFLFVLVILVVVGLALLLATRRSEQQTLGFDQPVRRAEVTLPAGAVAFVATDGPVRVQRTASWVLVKPVSSERVDDGVLRVEVRSRRTWLGGDVTYRVEVPAAADVQASTGAGAVSVHGTTGEVDVRTAAGTVTLADLSGRVRATTQAGQVRGTGLGPGEVDASSSAGTVSLAFDAPPDRVEARTDAGSVELLVPDQRYAVDASSYAGTTRVEVEHDPAASRRLLAHSNAGAVRVGRR